MHVCAAGTFRYQKGSDEGQCGISNMPEATVNVQFLVTHKLNDILNSYLDVARGKERGWIVNPDTSFLRFIAL